MAAGGGLIGALRVTLSADTAAFQQGMTAAERKAASSGKSISRSLGGVKTAVSGLMAGISISAIVAVTQRALDYASSLGEVAKQLSVTTKDLQEYRYAASQVGIEQDEMDKGLSKLSLTMGKAREGVKAPVEAFKQLSDILGKDILTSAATAGDAIPLISDAFKKIEDPTRRAALAAELFGAKLGNKFLTLLDEGSAGINGLRDAAQKLGVVLSDEQIQSADDTADKLSALKQVLEANIAGAVADNAKSIYDFVSSIEALIRKLPEAIRTIENFRSRLVIAGATIAQFNPLLLPSGKDQARADAKKAGLNIRENQIQSMMAGSPKVDIASLLPAPKALPSAGAGAVTGGGGSKGKSAEQLASEAERKRKDAIRDKYNADRDELRGQMDIIDAQADLATDVKDRGVLAERRLALEKTGADAEVAYNLAMGEITKEQADKQLALNETINGLRLEKQKQDELYDIQEEQIRRHEAIAQSSIDVQEMEASLATTAAERRTIEIKILEARYALLRQAQQDILDDPRSSMEQKDAAGRRLIDLDKLQAGATEQTLRGTAGPMESYLRNLPDTAAEIQEAFEGAAVNGVGRMNDELAESISNMIGLKGEAGEFLDELIKIGLQMAQVALFGNGSGGGGGGLGGLLGGLGSLIGGGGGSGGMSFAAQSAANFSLPGFADGGRFKIGGKHGLDTNLLSINGTPAAMVNRGETVDVMPANDRQRAGSSFIFQNDFRGADATAVTGIKARLDQMERELPGRIVGTVSDAKARGVLRG
ncbi:hypothetical protein U1769_24140 [Sphingomonas sp. ZT3P38]|uniref:hypothetical protein n=1 Tax=Parasphingomonas zepuensis TaxID=3096161 RepID=UPI002FC5FD3D